MGVRVFGPVGGGSGRRGSCTQTRQDKTRERCNLRHLIPEPGQVRALAAGIMAAALRAGEVGGYTSVLSGLTRPALLDDDGGVGGRPSVLRSLTRAPLLNLHILHLTPSNKRRDNRTALRRPRASSALLPRIRIAQAAGLITLRPPLVLPHEPGVGDGCAGAGDGCAAVVDRGGGPGGGTRA